MAILQLACAVWFNVKFTAVVQSVTLDTGGQWLSGPVEEGLCSPGDALYNLLIESALEGVRREIALLETWRMTMSIMFITGLITLGGSVSALGMGKDALAILEAIKPDACRDDFKTSTNR